MASPTDAPARRTRSSASGRGRGRGRGRETAGPRATFSQLLPYLFEHRGILSFILVLSVLGALTTLAQPLLVGQVITVVEEGVPVGPLVWVLVVLVVVSALLSGYQHYLLQRTGEGVVRSSRMHLTRKILRLRISEFDTRRTGDLVSRVGSDTTLLRAVLTQGLVEAVGGAVTFVGALIAMIVLDPVLLGLTVIVIGIAIATVSLLSLRVRDASRRAQDKIGDVAAAVERAIGAVRTIRAAGATERETAAIEAETDGAYREGVKVAKISALIVPIAGIAMQLSLLVVIGVGGIRVASGATSVANLVMFIIFLFMLILPLGQAFGAVTSVNQALGALGRIREVLDLPDEDAHDRDGGAAAVVVGAANASAAPDAPAIAFEGVRFAYTSRAAEGEADAPEGDAAPDGSVPGPADGSAGSGEARDVLRGVSFQVPRGRRVALVGPSGAGKSTTFALIERFYDPTAGVVRMGGLDLRAIDRADLRAQIGYVEQDAPVLAGTIRDNLTLGRPDATDDECVDVLRAVNLGAVLERDPAGLAAPVGEDGIMLSGGERQRLAIARALLAAPPILLLDESTSSLDGVNERMMREAIDAVAEGRTLIVIAHRLSTVVDSDRIVVLDGGEVVGEGTHSELVESTPLYRELAKHQLLV